MNQAFFHFTAQSSSTDVGDFLQQIGGLVALLCVLSVLWIGLMTVIIRRERARRRRQSEGLDPNPDWRLSVPRWRSGAPTPASSASRAGVPPLAIPTPDFDMLINDLADGEGQGAAWDGEDDPADDSAPEAADEPPAAQNRPRAEAKGESVELLRVWRDQADGVPVVEIGGRQFRSLADLRAAGLERHFRAVLSDLQALPDATAPAAPAPPAPTSQPILTPARARPPAPAPLGADEAISMRPSRMFRDMRRAALGHAPEPSEALPPAASIPDQIEALLQQRLAEAPAFAGQSIHVTPSLEGGVRIEVDGMYYAGVGEVADDAVRALLVEVVQEWEESQ